MMRSAAVLSLTLTLLCVQSNAALAQSDYPNRAITIVVPLSVGGIADIVPRMIAEKLSAKLGQPVIIENKPGAGHNIGAEYVAKAAPDGYTLLATPPAPLALAPHLSEKLPFNPSDFTAVSILTTGQIVLIANPSLPATDLTQLVAYAKANPNTITAASSGLGTSPHLTLEMLQNAAGVRFTHVPYRGLGPAVSDLLSGHVNMMFDNLGNSLPHLRSGKLKALAVAADRRIPELPDTPTVAETYPGFKAASWFALVAPPKTPAHVAEKLSRAIAEVLQQDDIREKLNRLAMGPVGNTPAEATAFLRAESRLWGEVIARAGIKPGTVAGN
jgi:tripartite-type tricarboxylate transporter receptor subunit TctC